MKKLTDLCSVIIAGAIFWNVYSFNHIDKPRLHQEVLAKDSTIQHLETQISLLKKNPSVSFALDTTKRKSRPRRVYIPKPRTYLVEASTTGIAPVLVVYRTEDQ